MQAFALEETHLQRILGILHAAHRNVDCRTNFQVELKNGKSFQFDTVDELLRHDNQIANPISSLWIRSVAASNASSCEVFFHGERQPFLSSVTISVEALDTRWADSLTAELEEQVVRTALTEPIYRIQQSVPLRNLVSTFIYPLVLVAAFILLFVDFSGASNVLAEQERLLLSAATATTQEQKIDFLFEHNLFQLQAATKKSNHLRLQIPSINSKLAIALLPALVALILVVYLFKHCYPPAVFAWGDCGQAYIQLRERRKSIWSILITVLMLGLLVNLSSPIISSWLGL